ncbi:MAG: type IV pilus modification protein PilV [Gammaproteobacteria bacterium]
MNHCRHEIQKGFTLLEVLIAVVVFAIGLLGIAGLQVAGMRFTHGSQLRAVATMQAENMADRMRANMTGVRDGDYNITGAMPTSFETDCGAEECTPAELAEYDLVLWNDGAAGKPNESNATTLPGGEGVVCLDSTPDDGDAADWACDSEGIVYAVKLTWNERTVGADDVVEGEDEESDRRKQFLFVRVVP